MSPRIFFISLVLLTVPALSQQSTMGQRVPGQEWSAATVRPEPPHDFNSKAFRVQAINHDAQDLAKLSAELQTDLRQLQRGLLSKELAQNLKKMEKLSKKLRQEVSQ